ncbi:MAG: nucleotidyl transferase AbiEii/AbiGii toxin family protein [Bacteroidales bacterium]
MLQKAAVDKNLMDLLLRLQSDPVLNNFILAGGTALALTLGHRKSVVIDLFSDTDFDEGKLLEHLERNYDFRMNFMSRSTLRGSVGDVRVDLIAHNYPYLKKPLVMNGIRLLSYEDIAAMKVNAIAGDGTRVKDFIDIYFLLNEFSFGEIIGFFSAKYSSRNNAHAIKSLAWFEDADVNDWPVMIKESNLTFKEVEKKITIHRKRFLAGEGIS